MASERNSFAIGCPPIFIDGRDLPNAPNPTWQTFMRPWTFTTGVVEGAFKGPRIDGPKPIATL